MSLPAELSEHYPKYQTASVQQYILFS